MAGYRSGSNKLRQPAPRSWRHQTHVSRSLNLLLRCVFIAVGIRPIIHPFTHTNSFPHSLARTHAHTHTRTHAHTKSFLHSLKHTLSHLRLRLLGADSCARATIHTSCMPCESSPLHRSPGCSKTSFPGMKLPKAIPQRVCVCVCVCGGGR